VTGGIVSRFLVVNADDFGLTTGVNRGIIGAHEHGIVTSASLMVRAAAAQDAAAYARNSERLCVGLHLDFGEWRYADGELTAAYQVVDNADAGAIRMECERQLFRFESLLGRRPTHLDSHQHAHLSEPARSVVLELAARLSIPLRSCSENISYCGAFYGQTGEGTPYPEGLSAENLVKLLHSLPSGWTELGCHPGYSDKLDSVYKLEREEEIRVLCSKQIREVLELEGIELRSFAEFPDRRRASTRD
jgi:predicted glycoside hydrolase/deacetylase ChbG (UPF0249 family)